MPSLEYENDHHTNWRRSEMQKREERAILRELYLSIFEYEYILQIKKRYEYVGSVLALFACSCGTEVKLHIM